MRPTVRTRRSHLSLLPRQAPRDTFVRRACINRSGVLVQGNTTANMFVHPHYSQPRDHETKNYPKTHRK
jgi:hypothetical protein